MSELIYDAETGEVVELEKPSENEYALKVLTESGVVTEGMWDMLDQYEYWQDQYDNFRYQLQKAMKKHNIKKWKNDYFTATLKDASISKKVDVKALKKDGLYEKYTKLVPVKGSLIIKMKGK